MDIHKHNVFRRSRIIAAVLSVVGIMAVTISYTQDSNVTESLSAENNQRLLNAPHQSIDDTDNSLDAQAQFHPYTTTQDQCYRCHEVYLTSGSEASYIVFIENSSEILTSSCLKCHPHDSRDHPVMITSSYPIPEDLLHSENMEITCLTCHNPHFQRYSSRAWVPRSFTTKIQHFVFGKKDFKTYFLRRNNADKELCMACHDGIQQQIQFSRQQ